MSVNRRFLVRTPQRDRHVSDGTRIRAPLRDRQTFYIVLVSLCQNCARIQRFQFIRVTVERKQIPRFVGNVSSEKKRMEWLESRAVRPRQARYQAALRPDMKCTIDSKALSDFTAIHRCNFSRRMASHVWLY